MFIPDPLIKFFFATFFHHDAFQPLVVFRYGCLYVRILTISDEVPGDLLRLKSGTLRRKDRKRKQEWNDG